MRRFFLYYLIKYNAIQITEISTTAILETFLLNCVCHCLQFLNPKIIKTRLIIISISEIIAIMFVKIKSLYIVKYKTNENTMTQKRLKKKVNTSRIFPIQKSSRTF